MNHRALPLKNGVTLLEVLVGVALLAVLGGALGALQVGTLRANRNAQVRLLAAALLADEVVMQRVHGGASDDAGSSTGACAITHMPDGWSCLVVSRCLPLPGVASCATRLFTVELRPPSGPPLHAQGAAFQLTGALP